MGIAKGFGVSTDWLLFGDRQSDEAQSDGPVNIHHLWRDAGAVSDVPPWLHERIGALMSVVRFDLNLRDPAVRPATIELLTATLLAVHKKRGRSKATPGQLLRELADWKGGEAVEDYLLASLRAANIATGVQRRRKG